jgi:hypothetical protein
MSDRFVGKARAWYDKACRESFLAGLLTSSVRSGTLYLKRTSEDLVCDGELRPAVSFLCVLARLYLQHGKTRVLAA